MSDKIRVISRPDPLCCGGTDTTVDDGAPKTIKSDKMTLFSATSVLGEPINDRRGGSFGYISAYAAPAGTGYFIYLEKGNRLYGNNLTRSVAFVGEDIFPSLVRAVNKFGLAKDNGYHSTTHGLPMNFGGSINIRYASGETISISNNQSPVLSYEAGVGIAAAFEKALAGAKVSLPPLSSLVSVRFCEERKSGGFKKSVLTLNPDGTGKNEKSTRFDTPKVYTSEKTVDAETVAKILKTIDESLMFAWSGLPENEYYISDTGIITFVFGDGSEIAIDNKRILPEGLGHAFFDIELEISVKN